MTPNALKVEFTCGGSFDRDSKPMDWPQVQAAMKAVEAELLATYGGYTKLKTFGGWIKPKTKDLIEDQSVLYTCIVPLDTPEFKLRFTQGCCIGAFNQTSVPMCITQVYSQF